MKQIYLSIMALLAIPAAGASNASAGGLLISIDKLQQAGGSGSFEVLLTNTEPLGGTTYNVAGFSFALLADASSGITFNAADYPTSGSPPYIFDGSSLNLLDPMNPIPLSYDPFSNTHFSASDSEFPYTIGDPLSIAVNPGDSFSLGLISFTSLSPVTLASLQSLIVPAGTILSDEDFKSIPYSLPGAAVPEPSSVVMLALGSLGLIGMVRLSRLKKYHAHC